MFGKIKAWFDSILYRIDEAINRPLYIPLRKDYYFQDEDLSGLAGASCPELNHDLKSLGGGAER